jgi:hypothetical protein
MPLLFAPGNFLNAIKRTFAGEVALLLLADNLECGSQKINGIGCVGGQLRGQKITPCAGICHLQVRSQKAIGLCYKGEYLETLFVEVVGGDDLSTVFLQFCDVTRT